MKKQKFAEVKSPYSTKLASLNNYNFTQKWGSVFLVILSSNIAKNIWKIVV